MSGRPWTRAGTVATGSHLFYELGCGVAMPYASRLGAGPAAVLWGVGTASAFRAAGRRPRSEDPAFAVLNGVYLSAVLGHFAAWPRKRVAGVPWLIECEGMSGRLMPAYNVILYSSAVAAVGGFVENRRGLRWGLLVPLAVPVLVIGQRREFARLVEQARLRPRWWNRRLQRRTS